MTACIHPHNYIDSVVASYWKSILEACDVIAGLHLKTYVSSGEFHIFTRKRDVIRTMRLPIFGFGCQ